MSLWKWLGVEAPADGSGSEAVAEIERALSMLEPDRARFLACFAYILTRSSRADHEVTAEEAALMERIVADRGGIPPEQAAIVVRIARTSAVRSAGTDDFIVTREFNAIATHEQKLALLDCLFAVSAADRSILTVEDNEIRRIANELKLEHGEYIAVRSRYLQNLKVLSPKSPSS